jgi:hypothetical protein
MRNKVNGCSDALSSSSPFLICWAAIGQSLL